MSDSSNKVQEVTGQAKDTAGKVLGDEDFQARGVEDQSEAKVGQVADDAKDALEGSIDEVFKKDEVKDVFKK